MKKLIHYIFVFSLCLSIYSCKSHKSVTTSTTTKSKKETITAVSTTKSLKKQFADKLGVNESEIKNERLYKFINEWTGVPYKYAGKDKNGIDCSGLTAMLYLNVYKKTISSNTRSLVEETKKINISDLNEGDLVFFITNGKSISHVGVYLQNNKFVHASTKKGVMISDLNEPYFKQTYTRSARVTISK